MKLANWIDDWYIWTQSGSGGGRVSVVKSKILIKSILCVEFFDKVGLIPGKLNIARTGLHSFLVEVLSDNPLTRYSYIMPSEF